MEDIKPCPFCGKPAFVWHSRRVVCSDMPDIWKGENGCMASMVGDNAVEKWNKREDQS